MPKSDDELIAWAREEAQSLRSVETATPDWQLKTGHTSRGIEFLRSHAGKQSSFFTQANKAASDLQAADSMLAVAECLEGWASYIEAGMSEEPLALRSRVEASTDLMEQVQVLLDDARVHPAAPVVLAGAALEEYLRGLIEASNLTVKGKPGLAAYAAALRTADLLTTQDVKDVTALAGTRNDAAHGDFAKITAERAHLMADQVNLFLRQKVGGT